MRMPKRTEHTPRDRVRSFQALHLFSCSPSRGDCLRCIGTRRQGTAVRSLQYAIGLAAMSAPRSNRPAPTPASQIRATRMHSLSPGRRCLPAGGARSKLAESSFSHQQGSAAKACSIGHSPPAQCSGHTADSGTPPVRQADLLDRRLHLQVFIRRLLLQQPVIACTADDGQNAHPFQGPIL